MNLSLENQEILAQDYFDLVTYIDQGREEMAALQLRRLRQAYSWCENRLGTLREIVNARIAMKSMSHEIDNCRLNAEACEDEFLKAETLFTRGLIRFHQNRYIEGAKDFSASSQLFLKFGNSDRKLLSDFNCSIGQINARRNGFFESDMVDFNRIEREAKRSKNEKVVGLCLRQRSYILQSLGRTSAAYSESVKSLRYLCGMAPRSDVQLARLQAADCALDMNRKDAALRHIEYVIDPVENRVLLPLAYVKARVEDKWDDFDPRRFPVQIPLWMEKIRKTRNIEGPRAAGTAVFTSSSEFRSDIKPQSLEGKLLEILNQGRCPKKRLIESLWPQHLSDGPLDNRLHRLISRLNKKLQGLIEFDGEAYRMKSSSMQLNS